MLICMFIILFGGSTTKGLYACCVTLKKHTFSRAVCLHCWIPHCFIFCYCVVLLPTTPENVTLYALTVSYSGVSFPKLSSFCPLLRRLSGQWHKSQRFFLLNSRVYDPCIWFVSCDLYMVPQDQIYRHSGIWMEYSSTTDSLLIRAQHTNTLQQPVWHWQNPSYDHLDQSIR